MVRGGSWNNDSENARAAYRNRNEPGNRNNNLGFRLASTLPGRSRGGQGCPGCA
ncbi:SUMF1/EgtB/PvdO family nonheme iron enzyme [Candidatus Accumulibacter vicinus]|uniref:SUMF1/EgtB/PvdO family nonheme iron enzyme n=1 Tax=Candidatus Accumulibacter vicinus TaxID=2954382 RepID=UPI00308110E9